MKDNTFSTRINISESAALGFDEIEHTIGDVINYQKRNDLKKETHFVLNLVTRAASALENMEKRLKATEAWALESVKRSREDFNTKVVAYEDKLRANEKIAQDLQAQLNIVRQRYELEHERARLAEERAVLAEKHAKDAQDWITRVNDTMKQHLLSAVTIVERSGFSSDHTNSLVNTSSATNTNVTPFSARSAAVA